MTTDTAVRYDPYDYAVHEDPYPLYARLREEAPVFRNDERGFYALSRHADVMAGFQDPRLSSAHGVSIDPVAWGPHASMTMSFLAMDPPRHTLMRALVSRGFTARRVLDLEPRIREIARGYVDRGVEAGTFEFVGELAGRFPMDVISELMGVPEVDRDELRRLADLLVHREEGVLDVPPSGIAAAGSLFDYYVALLAERRARPGDDLTSALTTAEVDGERLTDDDIIAFLFLMVVAGNETTAKLLANAWFWAARHPDQRAVPFTDPQRIPEWVEETLRFDNSTQLLARLATDDIELHGVTVPKGAQVLLLIGSANRDPRVFDDPDRYRIGRDTRHTASFGVGRHFCLGASLARLEARVCLEELVHRVADYDVDVAAAQRVHSVNVRGFSALPTTVVPR
ncbi:MAG TPA: cytochrome P450 [Mycobacteriales bacterium]|nr:cytochrome P450 [Mycobacteriales bacterium]